jgi:hypothetical protein
MSRRRTTMANEKPDPVTIVEVRPCVHPRWAEPKTIVVQHNFPNQPTNNSIDQIIIQRCEVCGEAKRLG